MQAVKKIRELKEQLVLGCVPGGMTQMQYVRWQAEFAEALIQYADELEVKHGERYQPNTRAD